LSNFWTLNEAKYNHETYTLLRGKALADYQGKYKPEVNWAGVEYLWDCHARATVSIQLHSALSEIVALVISCRTSCISCRTSYSSFSKTFTVPITFFPVTSPQSETFASLTLVLRAHYAICKYMFAVGFQYNFQ